MWIYFTGNPINKKLYWIINCILKIVSFSTVARFLYPPNALIKHYHNWSILNLNKNQNPGTLIGEGVKIPSLLWLEVKIQDFCTILTLPFIVLGACFVAYGCYLEFLLDWQVMYQVPGLNYLDLIKAQQEEVSSFVNYYKFLELHSFVGRDGVCVDLLHGEVLNWNIPNLIEPYQPFSHFYYLNPTGIPSSFGGFLSNGNYEVVNKVVDEVVTEEVEFDQWYLRLAVGFIVVIASIVIGY